MLQLDANEVAARLARVPLIDALERAFRSEFHSPARQHYTVGSSADGDHFLLTMPAWHTGRCIGIKLATVFPGNSRHGQPAVHAVYALFSGTDGSPIATLDGTELTRRRTAAASALAARFLARPEASRLLMVGTGALAPHIIETYMTARPITAVRIWGRSSRHAQAVAGSFAGRSIDIEAIDDLQAGVRWADIISCATLATAPQVSGVDTREGALAESGELVQALAAGVITAADIHGDLAALTRGTISGRDSADEITLFKSVGCAIEDLAAAQLALGLDSRA